MSYRNYGFRKIRNWVNRIRLKNKDFSLLSSNCNGGCICHDLGLPFRSPLVNLCMNATDYMKFLGNPREYLDKSLDFINDSGKTYPVARLGDITLHFMHYKTVQDATDAWKRRKERINWDNLFVLMTDKDGCTDAILRDFDSLPYKNKIVFTHIPHPEIQSAVYIPGFENESEVGNCDAFINQSSGKKYFDAFDYVGWFNRGK